jgi:hypothetical protein
MQALLQRASVAWLALGLLAAHGLGLPLWEAQAEDLRRVELAPGFVEGLAWLQTERTGRAPDAAERAALARSYAEEEVLYREALALGLERGDTIIRRRLVQKMRFLVEDTVPVGAPTEAQLAAVVAAHPEAFRAEARAAFVQVVLPEALTEAEAQDALRRAAAGPVDAAEALGVALPTPNPDGALPLSMIGRRYGVEVAEAVAAAPVGAWQGPLRGPHGWHLLYVEARAEAEAPGLAEPRVAKRALAMWTEAERSRLNRAALQRLMARYEVVLPEAEAALARAEVAP